MMISMKEILDGREKGMENGRATTTASKKEPEKKGEKKKEERKRCCYTAPDIERAISRVRRGTSLKYLLRTRLQCIWNF